MYGARIAYSVHRLSYRLENTGNMIRLPARSRIFSLFQTGQTGPEGPKRSRNQWVIGAFYPVEKAAGA